MKNEGSRWSRASWPKRLGWIGGGILALFLVIQLVPYGRDHSNPPVTKSPAWVGAQTEQIFNNSCGDCHSNLTKWPWYSNVAPVSWLVQHDVDEGRQHLNFSNWNQSHAEHGHEGHESEELGETILNGEMPPAQFLITHPEARLTDAEKAALADGLAATAGLSPSAEVEHESSQGNE